MESFMKRYIIKVTHSHSQKTKYVSELPNNGEFGIKCTANIENALLFNDYIQAWIIAKMKYETYFNEVTIEILEIDYE